MFGHKTIWNKNKAIGTILSTKKSAPEEWIFATWKLVNTLIAFDEKSTKSNYKKKIGVSIIFCVFQA
jgi:hypothetical protein